MGAGLLIVIPLFAVLMVWAARSAKARQRAIDDGWRAFAEARRLRFLPPEGPWHRPRGRRIKGRVDHVDVIIDTYSESQTDSNGNTTSSTYTRVVAAADAPLALTAKVYREHFFSGLGRALGFQDVEVRDPEFDRAFVVKASEPEQVRALLAEPLRSALLAFDKHAMFRYENGQMTLTWSGYEDDHAVLDGALAIATAACGPRDASYR